MSRKTIHFIDLIKTFSLYSIKEHSAGNYWNIIQMLLSPALISVIIVFSLAHRSDYPPVSFMIYVFLGMIIWQLFNGMVIISSDLLNHYRDLIKSLKFPLETLVFGQLINLILVNIFSVLILLTFMYFFSYPVRGILWYPVILFFYIFFLAGLSFLILQLNIYLRFLKRSFQLGLFLLWLLTPIFYETKTSGGHYFFNQFNPVYWFITVTRETIFYGQTPGFSEWLILLFISGLFFIVGYALFFKNQKYLIEGI